MSLTATLLVSLLAAPRAYGKPEKVVDLKSKEITECSGLARSIHSAGTYWTHNDSGDTARFFRFALTGEVVAEFSLAGVKAIDWEDISSATVRGRGELFLGDIGDNAEKRPSIFVYRLAEPKGKGEELKRFDTIEVRYPDRPQNSETLIADPQANGFWIVTKVNRGKSGVYFAPFPRGSAKVTLKKMGDVEVGSIVPGSQMVTGGDLSADGKWVVLRTYTAAYEFAVGKKREDWFRSKPVRIDAPIEAQGEAIVYAPDGKAILTASEGRPCPVSRIPLAR